MTSNVLCRTCLWRLEPTAAKVPGRPGEKEACCAPPKTSVELDFTPFVDQLAKAWNGSSLSIVRQLIPVVVQVR